MKRIKIDYGIDLGTTNSAICRIDRGEVSIIKSDISKDTMPSCVSFTRKQTVRTGETAYNALKSDKRSATKVWKSFASNSFDKFKRQMGTSTKYHSEFMGKDYSPQELSAEVLKMLKSFVLDEDVRSVVITVPAKFHQGQKDVTMEAARLAGFEYCELLQEPIAASMAYGMTGREKDGLWLVFDFGGGTFDAALVKAEDGIMQVFDTEGDNYLGGKNLDEAIVAEIIIPYLSENFSIYNILNDKEKQKILIEAMCTYAEELKNQLSFKPFEDIITDLGELGCDDDGNELEIDLRVSQEQLEVVLKPVFQRAIDLSLNLLERNNLTGNNLSKVILVGGPTHSPILRKMIGEQISSNVDTSVDPMTVVATGAAIYASTLDSKIGIDIDDSAITIDLGYPATSVDSEVSCSIKIIDKKNILDGTISVEIVSADKSWSSGRFLIDEKGDIIDLKLKENKLNPFEVFAYDDKGNRIPCFPDNFQILQGTDVPSAPLSYNVGIEKWDVERKMGVFVPFIGLEKNKPLPAIGIINGLKTSTALRPGISSDAIVIPIYEADYYKGVERAAYFNLTYNILITGDMVPQLVPEESDVDLTLKVSDSNWELSAYFPSIDISIDVEVPRGMTQTVDEEYLVAEIEKGFATIDELYDEDCDVQDERNALQEVEKELLNGAEKHQVKEHLQDALRKIDKLYASTEWERVESHLRESFKRVEYHQQKNGSADTAKAVEELRHDIDIVIKNKNIHIAKELIITADNLNFQLAKVEHYIAWILDWDNHFTSKKWQNEQRARQLINQGKQLIYQSPTADELGPIVGQIINLLPPQERPSNAKDLLR